VSKKESLSAIKLALKKANALEVKVIKMEQGQKVCRFVAWSFLNNTKRQTFYQCLNY
jgi:23S rRNA (adenine1618-N6)-methyltransferase